MKTTVRDYLKDELFAIGFRDDEYVRAVQFAIQDMNQNLIATGKVMREDGKEVLVKDCWETDSSDYIEDHLEWLFNMIQPRVLQWCLNVIHSLK